MLTVLVLSCRRLHYLLRTLAAARAHFERVEPEVRPRWVCFDNGSSPGEQARLGELGFDLLLLSRENLGQGPALNLLLAAVRTPWFLLLEDDWELVNPQGVPFVRESVAVLTAEPRLGQVKLDALHDLCFQDRGVYDGPFRAPGASVPFYVQDPRRTWGGFCCPPGVTRTLAVRSTGPFLDEQPFRKHWAESEYSARFAQRFLAAKSPEMLLFHHIGEVESPGWRDGYGAPSPSTATAAAAPPLIVHATP